MPIKFSFVLLGLLCLLSSCHNMNPSSKYSAQKVDFETGSFEKIKRMAKQENKPIFVDVYTDWCKPCKIMDKEVFRDRSVAGYLNTNYIPYKLDAESQEGIVMAINYNITVFPTVLYLDSNGQFLDRKVGLTDPKEIIRTGKMAKRSSGSTGSSTRSLKPQKSTSKYSETKKTKSYKKSTKKNRKKRQRQGSRYF